LGDYTTALDFYQRALIIRKEVKDTSGEIITLENIGGAHSSMGDSSQAFESYQRVLKIADRYGARHSVIVGGVSGKFSDGRTFSSDQKIYPFDASLGLGRSLGGICNIHIARKNYAEALEFCERALRVHREDRDRYHESGTLQSIGDIHTRLANYSKALEFYQRALVVQKQVGDSAGEASTLADIGYLMTRQKQPELAIVFLKEAVNVRERIRQDLRPLARDLQTTYTKRVSGSYRDLADLLLSQGRVLEAQQVLELLKVQELRDFTKDTRYGGTADRNLLNPLEKKINDAFDDKIKLGDRLTQCEQTKCSEKSQLIAQVTQANEIFAKTIQPLKKALRAEEHKDPAQLETDKLTIAAQNIIIKNPRKTVLLYPLVLDDKLWLVWGTQAGKTGIIFNSVEVSVTRKALSTKVLELSEFLKTPSSDPKKIKQVSQQLYQWLIQPIRQQLNDNGIENIVFSLDRATRYIPMAALHDGKQYLIENFTVSTILTAQTDTTDKLSPKLSENPVLGLGVTRAIGSFSALPAVQSELDSISKIFPGMNRLDQDFTEATLRENISDHRILHIATHGSFNTTDPNNSFLLLGNGKQLTIPTIESMKNLAGTHLVVLSACETGKGGMSTEGMEVAGIGHYFLRSGAKSVMASLWLVNDPATALLMRDFYTQLATGKLTKAEALRQTQLAFLKGDRTTASFTDLDRAGVRLYIPGQLPTNSLAHPYYWAPFILIGNNL
jgi:CHAT domain-containing protein